MHIRFYETQREINPFAGSESPIRVKRVFWSLLTTGKAHPWSRSLATDAFSKIKGACIDFRPHHSGLLATETLL